MSSIVVGSRVLIKDKPGLSGTARYVGETEFRAGTWVGIELDTPNGKNNGSVQGVTYFQCRPSYGLFVPIAAVMEDVAQTAAAPRSASGSPPRVRGDEVLFRGMAHLFAFDRNSNEWLDRGVGHASVLQHRQSKQIRFLVQEEETGRALCNHMIDPTTKLEENVSSDRAWVFRALDYASGKPVDEVFAVQFRTVEAAHLFKQCFDKAREHMAALLAAAREVAAAAEQAHQHSPQASAASAPAAAAATSAGGGGGGGGGSDLGPMPPPSSPPPPEYGAGPAGDAGAEAERAAMVAEATAAGGSPTGRATKAKRLRRRLSVVNNKVLAEGEDSDKLETAAFYARSAACETVSIYAAVSKKGYAPNGMKKQNQDALLVAEEPESKTMLLCVFDGHGEEGHHVSQSLKANLADAVFGHEAFMEDPARALSDAVEAVERDLLEAKRVDCRLSGSTAVMCLVRGNELIAGNIGDSRAVLAVGRKVPGRGKARAAVRAEDVTRDHKPDLPEERERIERTGGRVFAIDYGDGEDGPQRVWLSDADLPGLAMSRSVGDTVAKWAGVVSTPEITRRTLVPGNKFLVLASDGLWEFMESQEVVDIVHRSSGPNDALSALLAESTERWNSHEPVTDDTTIIIAAFKVA